MKTCAICGKPLEGGVVVHSECVPKWVPTSESLPSTDGPVLAFYHFGEHIEMNFIGVLDYYAYDEVPHFQHSLAGVNVSHWMPLPEPPKEAEQCNK